MHIPRELVAARRVSPGKYTKPRLYFSIFYKVADKSFEIAANTWEKAVRSSIEFDKNQGDEFYPSIIQSEAQFRFAWQDIIKLCQSKGYTVWGGNIFAHASKSDSGQNGLEFVSKNPNTIDKYDNTLKRIEIRSLPRLPWHESGYLILSCCNSGLNGERGWSPAQAFAFSQKIPTLGTLGKAYFSTTWEQFKRRSKDVKNLYLWAYDRAENYECSTESVLKGGLSRLTYTHMKSAKRIPGRVFR